MNKKYNTIIQNIDNQILNLIYKRYSILEENELFNKFDEAYYKKLNLDNKEKSIKLFNLINLFENKNKKQNKILYLGPSGSYTQDAAIKKFGLLNSFFSVNSISNLFEEIEQENADYAIIPIENSLNGLVNDTLNAFLKYNLNVIGEVILDIHHTFASNCEDINKVKTIYSKDIAFDQCSIFLEKYNLHNIEHIYVESTTKAANLASINPNSAAICSDIAAFNNHLNIMFSSIEDNPSNKTRFFVLSKKDLEKKNDIEYKTSFLVELPNISGSLIDFLQIFKKENINLYKIKSHITKGISNFFIEFNGHKNDKNVKKILKKYKNIKILGSYKKEVEDI
ncbi:prephenate dehydratase [Aliarcobacter lanthieri]|uniref:prephenate dehydratase n=1 Tax=Aliarcobacter lanthieri TaxID=1355374 RepID=UPI003AAB9961